MIFPPNHVMASRWRCVGGGFGTLRLVVEGFTQETMREVVHGQNAHYFSAADKYGIDRP
jgi:hypothetical protein